METKRLAVGSLTIALATLAACSDATSPAADARRTPILDTPSFALAAPFPGTSDFPATAEIGSVTVCVATGGTDATFEVKKVGRDATTGDLLPDVNPDNDNVNSTFALAAGKCTVVWDRGGQPTDAAELDNPVVVTVHMTSANFANSVIAFAVGDACDGIGPIPATSSGAGTSTTAACANAFHGSMFVFTTEPPATAVCDFTTFGGFVLEPNNISYGGNAGVTRNGVLFGELNFVNHENGDNIHVHTISSYTHPNSGPLATFDETRWITGGATVNGVPGFFVSVLFTDLGEPGTSDKVWLHLSGPGTNTTLISGSEDGGRTVDGGNVQLHKVCRPAPLKGPTQVSD